MNTSIILVGFMGTGKSTVGELVAERLDVPFVDTDDLVERQAGMSIEDIFTEHGEGCFRQLEQAAVQQVCSGAPAVVATGGGVLLNKLNVGRLQAAGILVHLEADPEEIWHRVRAENSAPEVQPRPLLSVEDPEAEIRRLLRERAPVYGKADLAVDTTGRCPEAAAEVVIERVTQAEQANLPGERGTSTLSLCFERSAVEYPIVVGPGLLHSVGALMCENSSLRGSRKLLVVTDETVEELYAEQLAADLQQLGFEVNRWVVPPGESTKTLEWTQRGCQVAVDCGLDRASTVVALGGGVVGDLAGFVAATFMRGINFVQVPTTLLAQVDASVGGKVAVNLPQGKNLVGAFHQPQLVVIDPEVLLSLPERHYAAGMAEVIKHGVIRDSDYFSFLESHVEGLRRRNADLLTKAIRGSCRIKAAVVQEDEREAGIRAILNFGHTVGHALESVSGYGQLLHGEAVSIGMVVAAELARQQGMLEQEPVQRLGKLLKGFGLPTRIEGAAVDELLEAMKRDKKAQSEKPRWVLPQGLGSASPGHNLPGAAVACALEAAGATACSQE